MDGRRERGSAEELISLYTGIFGRRPQRRLSDKVAGAIVVSWGSVAEIWLNLRDGTDSVMLDWHDPSVKLAAKYAAFGAAVLTGVEVNPDPGVHHVAMLTRLLGRAPERVREDDTLHYIWDGEVMLRFDALDAAFQPPPALIFAVAGTNTQMVIGYATAAGCFKEYEPPACREGAREREPEEMASTGDAGKSQAPDLRVIR